MMIIIYILYFPNFSYKQDIFLPAFIIRKGSFLSEDAVRKALYLRITELYKKWNGRPVSNWAMVRNQLAMDDKMQARILKYENY